MNEELRLLLSPLYDHDALAPEHLADLYRSALTDETIRAHKFRSVPPVSIGPLLGFDNPRIRAATLARYPDPAGGSTSG